MLPFYRKIYYIKNEKLHKIKKKNLKISGANNGKPLSIKTFNRAIEITGTKTYVYNAKDMSPVVGSPFRSIQLTSKFLPISPYTFPPKKS